MTTYPETEAALLALLYAAPGTTWTPKNCQADDYGVLDAPGEWACVVTQASDTIEADDMDNSDGQAGAHGERQEQHTLEIAIYRKVGNGRGKTAAIVASLKQQTADLADYLRQFPRLDDCPVVWRAEITRRSSPRAIEIVGAPGAAAWYEQIITLRVRCVLTPQYVEESYW